MTEATVSPQTPGAESGLMVRAEQVHKSFGPLEVLKGIDL